MPSSNLAYDYERFEQHPKKVPQIKEVPKTKVKKRSILKSVCVLALVLGALSSLIYTRVVQTEVSYQYNEAVKQLNELKSENSLLQIKLEETLALTNLEQTAKDDYGMTEVDNSKIEYVNFGQDSKAEVLVNVSIIDKIVGFFKGLFS